jgi:hypothetical protein
MPERRFQMTRLRAGDYLLPDNDGRTLWRIARYEERDGSLTRGDGTVVNGDFWALWRCRWCLDELDPETFEFETFHNYVEVQCLLPSRQAAIDAAMRDKVSR